MVFLLNEEKAIKMGEKLRVACYAIDKSKHAALTEALGSKLPPIDLLPKTDVMQDIIDRKLSKKKVIKKAGQVFDQKKIKKAKNPAFITDFYLLLSIVLNNAKKGTLTVLVAPEDEAIAKFAEKYISELFGAFGVKVFTGKGKEKKIIKALKKGKKKKRKDNVRKFISKNTLSSKGFKLFKQIRNAYEIEILAAGFEDNIRNGEFYIKSKGARILREALVNNLKDKKNKKAYNEFRKVQEFKFPSVKKAKKKFKRDFAPLMIKHIALYRYGIQFGSKEYFKEMNPLVASLDLDPKNFKSVVEIAISNK